MGETASAGVGTHLSPGDRHELTQRCGLRRAGSGNLIDSPDHYVANPKSIVLLAQKPRLARQSGVIELSEQHILNSRR